MTRRRRNIRTAGCCVFAAVLLASCQVTPAEPPGRDGPRVGNSRPSPDAGETSHGPLGAFLGSDPEGVRRIGEFGSWLGASGPRVGHTYLPGDLWSNIEGREAFLRPWVEWRRVSEDRLFVLNVPMQERNEAEVPDAEVRDLLRAGAAGKFDHHFRTLAERLVRLGAPDTVLVLGWEMNGATYTHRCAPDPEAWKTYWRRIVKAVRSVPGQEFRFDFAPSRGLDAIEWTRCYPGDEFVDVIGMDSYDQPAGQTFDNQVSEPFGLRHHVEFAADHGKPISYPEWGLFRNGDNPEYVRRMLAWFRVHKPLYQTVTDYCPHGVWRCTENPESAKAYREHHRPQMPPPPSGPVSPPPWYDNCFSEKPFCFAPGRPDIV